MQMKIIKKLYNIFSSNFKYIIYNYHIFFQCQLDSNSRCVQKRKVLSCVTSLGGVVDKDRCETDTPYTELICAREECPSWKYHDWAPVSKILEI